MITSSERSDIIRIMKTNGFSLSDSDSAHLEFGGQTKDKEYRIKILVVEDSPQIFITRSENIIFNDLMKDIDDLKIFLEERLYTYLEA